MPSRRLLAATLAAIGSLAPQPDTAVGSETDGQVEIEAKIVEVSAEISGGLGVAFQPVDSHYRSTGAQAPADASDTAALGLGGAGVGLMATLFPSGGGPLGAGPAAVGIGAEADGFFSSTQDLVSVRRHHPEGEPDDVVARRTIDWAVDMAATARIPFLRVENQGGRVVLAFQPLVGATFTQVETRLSSDQTFFGGEVLRTSECDTGTGVVAGAGLTAELPLLGDIPVLAGLFYKARHIPSQRVDVDSTFGFTEEVEVDSSWQHSVKLVVIVPITLLRE